MQRAATLKRLSRYFKPYFFMAILAILAMVLVALTEVAIPAILKPLIDNGFSTASYHRMLWQAPLTIIGLAFVRASMQYASSYLLSWISNRVLFNLRVQMFAQILKAPILLIQTQTASHLINAIVFEVNQVLSIFTNMIITSIRDALTVLGLIIYLFYLNWRLTLLVVLVFPIIAYCIKKINRRLRQLNRQYQEATSALAYSVEESITAYKVVKIHHAEAHQIHKFNTISAQLLTYAMRMVRSGGLAQPLTQFLSALPLAAVIALAIVQSAHHQTTVGGFVSFVTAMLLLISPLKHLMDINQPLQRGIVAAEMIFSIMDTSSEPQGGVYTKGRAQGCLCFKQVSFVYQDFQETACAQKPLALNHIDLTIAAGEMVALVGASGSGKTTLAHLIPRFFDPTHGQIFLDDIPLNEYALDHLRAQMALVSQDIVLFNDTIAANVAYGQEIDEARVYKALEAAYLSEVIERLPQGIRAQIGGNGVTLSGGQRQRLAIARAIYKDAPILILDEATSALDSESERYVQQALDILMQGRTTLVIAHRLSTIEKADRIIVLAQGKIIEQGTHQQLLSAPAQGVYQRLYELQFSR